MKKYCKAYYLKSLRQFSDWAQITSHKEPTLSDNTICYLWDDFTVATDPLQDSESIVEQVTSEWQHFCTHTLNFTIPKDLQAAYQKVG